MITKILRCQTAIVLLCLVSTATFSQPTLRFYLAPYEHVGLAAGYSVKRINIELGGAFRRDDIPADGYVSAAFYNDDQKLAQGMDLYRDNPWKQKQSILTLKVTRTGKKDRKLFKIYWGPYVRSRFMDTAPDQSSWSAADHAFADANRMAVHEKRIVVSTGLLLGLRGKVKENFYWDMNAGFKLLPISYYHDQTEFSDGSSKEESGWNTPYGFLSPGEFFIQLGLVYTFPAKAK